MAISTMSSLRDLTFRSVSGLTDARFSVIAESCHHLESVNLTNAPDISVDSVRALARGPAGPRLKSFTIVNGNIGEEALSEIVRFSSLQDLYFGSCHKLSDSVATSLAQMRGLRRLSIVNSANITDNVLRGVCDSCRLLESLRLELCPYVSSAGLAPLVRLPNLRELSLCYCPEIALGAALVVGDCQELRLCELTKTKVDDVALDVIVAGYAATRGCLTTLDVRQCNVSRMAVLFAIRDRPGLTILSDHGPP